MVGIMNFGSYLPYHRLNRTDIGKSWGTYAFAGEKAVANFDEDTVTMAVEACRDCLGGEDRGRVSNFYLASTTFPYGEKQSATLAAAALDLNPETFTMDLSGSLRSGTGAVRLAIDAVTADKGKCALVAASDIRMGMPSGGRELEFGDGSAALMVGNGDVVATIDGCYSLNHEIFDFYRPAGEKYTRSWEERFVREKGYTATVVKAVSEALETFNMTPEDVSRAVLAAPNPGFLKGAARALGFDPGAQAADPLFPKVGNTGTAHALLLLCAALEQAKPGDRLLWAGYGDGCDVMALTVTDAIENTRAVAGIQKKIETRRSVSYPRYLRWREIVETQPPMRPRSEPASAAALYRDRKCGLALYGSKCRDCGCVQYPVQRICMQCRAKDHFDHYPFAGKTGKIKTFSHDNLAVSPDPPTTVAAVDFEEGGRIMMDITDRDPGEIVIGMPVEMTFRKFRFTQGVQVYWWKSKPVRHPSS